MDATFEVIRILATVVFVLLLIVSASLLVVVVGIILFATGEGVVWLRSLRQGRLHSLGSRFLRSGNHSPL